MLRGLRSPRGDRGVGTMNHVRLPARALAALLTAAVLPLVTMAGSAVAGPSNSPTPVHQTASGGSAWLHGYRDDDCSYSETDLTASTTKSTSTAGAAATVTNGASLNG